MPAAWREEVATVRQAFAALEIEPTDDLAVITARYRALAREVHPDKLGSIQGERLRTLAGAEMVRLNAAKDLLVDRATEGSLVEMARRDAEAPSSPGQPADPDCPDDSDSDSDSAESDPWVSAPWADESPAPPRPDPSPGPDAPWPTHSRWARPRRRAARASPRRPAQARRILVFERSRRRTLRWLWGLVSLCVAAVVVGRLSAAPLEAGLTPASGVPTESEPLFFEALSALALMVAVVVIVKLALLAFRRRRAGLPAPRPRAWWLAGTLVIAVGTMGVAITEHQDAEVAFTESRLSVGQLGASLDRAHDLMASSVWLMLAPSALGLLHCRRQ